MVKCLPSLVNDVFNRIPCIMGLLLERKATTNLDSILKSRDIVFLTKGLCSPHPAPTDARSGLRSAGKGSGTSGASCVVSAIIQETFPHFLTKKDASLGFPQTFFIG